MENLPAEKVQPETQFLHFPDSVTFSKGSARRNGVAKLKGKQVVVEGTDIYSTREFLARPMRGETKEVMFDPEFWMGELFPAFKGREVTVRISAWDQEFEPFFLSIDGRQNPFVVTAQNLLS
jgi:hypothetical protein